MDSTARKCKELKRSTQCDDDSIIIKSPVLNDPKTNPCIKEQNLSHKCLIEYEYDKDKCTESMENYAWCKKFWDNIYYDRVLDNKKPYLPLPEDRPKIQAEFFEKMRRVSRGEEELTYEDRSLFMRFMKKMFKS